MYIIVTILEFEDTGEGPKIAMPIQIERICLPACTF